MLWLTVFALPPILKGLSGLLRTPSQSSVNVLSLETLPSSEEAKKMAAEQEENLRRLLSVAGKDNLEAVRSYLEKYPLFTIPEESLEASFRSTNIDSNQASELSESQVELLRWLSNSEFQESIRDMLTNKQVSQALKEAIEEADSKTHEQQPTSEDNSSESDLTSLQKAKSIYISANLQTKSALQTFKDLSPTKKAIMSVKVCITGVAFIAAVSAIGAVSSPILVAVVGKVFFDKIIREPFWKVFEAGVKKLQEKGLISSSDRVEPVTGRIDTLDIDALTRAVNAASAAENRPDTRTVQVGEVGPLNEVPPADFFVPGEGEGVPSGKVEGDGKPKVEPRV
eukprot:NODE_182_length_13754_cov_0.678067.p4 type:complete len:340 gc:universal NODE_182_length_13754_cov_0.678067:12276-11257(-)